ncbi:allatostatin-A receptor-like isoform X2 [Apostichopus japonicus]|uniref:allatostatin-A receptor-like isoform X2 n=1 Tax=Stichopus japonicus TaxID=307972 RepID=UPI003AB4034B
MESTNITERPRMETGWAVGIEHNIFVRVIYGFIAAVGITGNFLVCFALIRLPALRNRTSQFIIHLSVTDMLTCVWVIPFHFFPSTPSVPDGFLGEFICRVFVSKYPLWVTIIASIYSLLSVNLERFVAIVYPLVYKNMFTIKKSLFIMLLCWLIGSFANMWFFYNFDYDSSVKSCIFVPFSSRVQLFIGVYVFILIYVFPITANTFAQYYMIKTLKQQIIASKVTRQTTGRTVESGQSQQNPTRSSWKLKTAQDLEKTLLVVVVTFAVCWAPNQIIFFLYSLGVPIDFTRWYYHFSVMLALCNSCINPFIYTFKHKPFRYGVMKSLGVKRKSVTPFLGSVTNTTRVAQNVRVIYGTDANT